MKKIDDLRERVEFLGRELADSVRDFLDLKQAHFRLAEKNRKLLKCVNYLSKNDTRWSGMAVEDIVEQINRETQN